MSLRWYYYVALERSLIVTLTLQPGRTFSELAWGDAKGGGGEVAADKDSSQIGSFRKFRDNAQSIYCLRI